MWRAVGERHVSRGPVIAQLSPRDGPAVSLSRRNVFEIRGEQRLDFVAQAVQLVAVILLSGGSAINECVPQID